MEGRKNAIDDLLSTGVWTSRRVDSISSPRAPLPKSRTPSRSPTPASSISGEPTSTKPISSSKDTYTRSASRSPRSLQKPPPRPKVEDEHIALASEVTHQDGVARALRANEPPVRGTIDQRPILLESEISDADAARIHNEIRSKERDEERKALPKEEGTTVDSGERRFVLVPQNEAESASRIGDNERPRRSYTEPKDNRGSQDAEIRRDSRLNGGPSLERRRSRQDLPALETKLGPESPAFRRSSSYGVMPSPRDSKPPGRLDTRDQPFSPESIAYKGQGRGKGYFDVPVSSPRQRSTGGLFDRAGTPTSEKRRSGDSKPGSRPGSQPGSRPNSRPGTPIENPIMDKRAAAALEAYARRQENGDRPDRSNRLSTENGIRRSDSHPLMQQDTSHLTTDARKPQKSRRQTSRGYYTESDSDLADSSDSDTDKRRSKSYKPHRHRHTGSNLRPDDDRDGHLRSASKSSRSSLEVTGRKASPLPSPKVSPSQLPPIDRRETLRDHLAASRDPKKPDSRPNSRPVSPNNPYGSSSQSSSTLDVNSQKQKPRPLPRQGSPVSNVGSQSAGTGSNAAIPVPIPIRSNGQSQADSRRDNVPQPVGVQPPSKPAWQPPAFQPPTDKQNLDPGVGSYRRYSQDIEDGNIAPLPACPRIAPVAGKVDWLTSPRCPTFNICPSCFESTIAPTEFRTHFVPAPLRSSREKISCDFGAQPWYRIAWLLTRKNRIHNLGLLYDLAQVGDKYPLCIGKNEAVRKWHSVADTTTGVPVRNFDVCMHCVKSIEVLLPNLQGLFVRTDGHLPPGTPRVCDMRFDSKRFIHYFDALETMADIADENQQPPNPRAFVTLAKKFAVLPECEQYRELVGQKWHFITELPEFTVCPECFNEVVVPLRKKAIPALFGKEMRKMESASCQLYSVKMREGFESAVDRNDYKMLVARARERRVAELAWKGALLGGSKEEMARAMKGWSRVE